MRFSERLKELRAVKKTTQLDVAKAISLTDRAMRMYEAGIMEPKISIAQALADYFDVSIDYLVGRSSDTQKNNDISKENEVSAMEEMPAIAKELAKAGIVGCADIILSPAMHGWLRNRRLKNATAGLEEIEDYLRDKRLAIDYARYFEQHLKIPILVVENLADEESPQLRELLKKLFINHLTGNYADDSLYAAFIGIIKELTTVDVAILQAFYEVLLVNNAWNDSDSINYNFQLSHKKLMSDFNVEEIAIKASLSNLERCQLISTVHPTDTFNVGEMEGACIGNPSLTPLGFLFIRACIDVG